MGKLDALITGIVILVVVLFAVIFVLAIRDSDEESDPAIIFHNRDMEVRAVCTEDSGLLITTIFNSRIAGDDVQAVRMTEAEVQEYCSGEDGDA